MFIVDRKIDDETPAHAIFSIFHNGGAQLCGWMLNGSDRGEFAVLSDTDQSARNLTAYALRHLPDIQGMRARNASTLADQALHLVRNALQPGVPITVVKEDQLKEDLKGFVRELRMLVCNPLMLQLHLNEVAADKLTQHLYELGEQSVKEANDEAQATREREKARLLSQLRSQEKTSQGYLARASRAEAEVLSLKRLLSTGDLKPGGANETSAIRPSQNGHAAKEGAAGASFAPLWDAVFAQDSRKATA